MTTAPNTPKAKLDVDADFEKQVKKLQTLAGEESEARIAGEQTQWMMPELRDWDGDLFNTQQLGLPFDRGTLNDKMEDALKDPANPGTSGDLIVATTQIDYLACMQRAFTARHTMRRPRATLHAMARKRGHGHDRGPLVQGILEHVREMVTRSKSA